MKVGPKVPGPTGPADVGGPTPGEGAERARGTGAARSFAEVAGGARAEGPARAAAAPAPGAIAEIVGRLAAGEITRPEAVRCAAEAVVRAWPAEVADEATRARAVAEMTEYLAADPTFSALLDAAAGGPAE